MQFGTSVEIEVKLICNVHLNSSINWYNVVMHFDFEFTRQSHSNFVRFPWFQCRMSMDVLCHFHIYIYTWDWEITVHGFMEREQQQTNKQTAMIPHLFPWRRKFTLNNSHTLMIILPEDCHSFLRGFSKYSNCRSILYTVGDMVIFI